MICSVESQGTGNDVMELEELRAGSPSPPRLTTQVTPFHVSTIYGILYVN